MKQLRSSINIFLLSLWLCACKPKDGDIKASVEKELKKNNINNPVVVQVEKAVVTISGELPTATAKAEAEKVASVVENVKSVINNISLPAPVIVNKGIDVPADSILLVQSNNITREFPTVTAAVSNGVISLEGEVSKMAQRKILVLISALKPLKIDNKLQVK